MKLLLAIILMFPSVSFADEWTSDDTKRQAVYLTLHAVDWMQTRHIAKNPTLFSESNPLLGRHPSVSKVNKYFIATALMHTGISYALPPEYRKVFQYITIGVQAGYVTHNYNVGVKIGF